jgi:hypothetical protein
MGSRGTNYICVRRGGGGGGGGSGSGSGSGARSLCCRQAPAWRARPGRFGRGLYSLAILALRLVHDCMSCVISLAAALACARPTSMRHIVAVRRGPRLMSAFDAAATSMHPRRSGWSTGPRGRGRAASACRRLAGRFGPGVPRPRDVWRGHACWRGACGPCLLVRAELRAVVVRLQSISSKHSKSRRAVCSSPQQSAWSRTGAVCASSSRHPGQHSVPVPLAPHLDAERRSRLLSIARPLVGGALGPWRKLRRASLLRSVPFLVSHAPRQPHSYLPPFALQGRTGDTAYHSSRASPLSPSLHCGRRRLSSSARRRLNTLLITG